MPHTRETVVDHIFPLIVAQLERTGADNWNLASGLSVKLLSDQAVWSVVCCSHGIELRLEYRPLRVRRVIVILGSEGGDVPVFSDLAFDHDAFVGGTHWDYIEQVIVPYLETQVNDILRVLDDKEAKRVCEREAKLDRWAKRHSPPPHRPPGQPARESMSEPSVTGTPVPEPQQQDSGLAEDWSVIKKLRHD